MRNNLPECRAGWRWRDIIFYVFIKVASSGFVCARARIFQFHTVESTCVEKVWFFSQIALVAWRMVHLRGI